VGVIIPSDKFDSIDILKDIEVARHALDKKKIVAPIQDVECEIPRKISNNSDIPLLEWLDEDCEEEKFALVQSTKKKKKKLRTSLGFTEKEPPIRSCRTTPSVYRQRRGGGRKILLPKSFLIKVINDNE
jgi:hypothetical protein